RDADQGREGDRGERDPEAPPEGDPLVLPGEKGGEGGERELPGQAERLEEGDEQGVAHEPGEDDSQGDPQGEGDAPGAFHAPASPRGSRGKTRGAIPPVDGAEATATVSPSAAAPEGASTSSSGELPSRATTWK